MILGRVSLQQFFVSTDSITDGAGSVLPISCQSSI